MWNTHISNKENVLEKSTINIQWHTCTHSMDNSERYQDMKRTP
jgi:hypothetical protein